MTPEQIEVTSNIAQAAAVIFAVVVFIYQITQEKRNREIRDEELKIDRRAHTWSEINAQIHLINEACRGASISPAAAAQNYGEVLISAFQSEEDKTNTTVLFYHHLNLLHIVFLHQKFLLPSEIEGFRRWSTKVIGAFLEAVPPLKDTLVHVLDGGDLYSREFVAFLKTKMLADYLRAHPLPAEQPS